ncbi:hypothetical protein COU01_04575 [Candidatus Falkowbacteria bacterium CG10_big_fil_rev_8_21_14_0_10_44_15]|uniref:Transcription regulator TrmB N-terminal domain-containing protein n=1 Tax=Candidatus Falkowbacteria bacterium CG10_big_fil_rev_8_21_14_0_10_44_15 TaxID=1974569 RepID=A0A2H0UYK7_9BACT|nr:MAG: hypothetical protein COU01_04575 [Candidatus Falkowbacteria bacterium CG10_big_fil_rev_8_21_14_0_10_44_15]
MKNSDIIPLLKEAGFSEKEAVVYLSALKLNKASVVALAKDTKINRSTLYLVTKSLLEKGMLNETWQHKKRAFAPENPEHILELVKTRQNAFKKALPELAMLFRSADKDPKVKFYEGAEGIKTMYIDTLEAKEPILVYGSITDMWGVVSKEWKKSYVEQRVKHKIFNKCIIPDTGETREYIKNDKEEWRETRLVPHERFNFTNEINIYNNKVAIFSFREKIGVIIESHEISDTQRKIFELAWIGTMSV